MNILFYCDEYPPDRNGGIGSVTKVVAESLAKKGNTVVIVGNYEYMKIANDIFGYSIINQVHIHRLLSSVYKTRKTYILKVALYLATKFKFSKIINDLKFKIALHKLHLTEYHIEQIIKTYNIDILEMPDYQDELLHDLNKIVEFRKFSIPMVIRVHGSCSFMQFYVNHLIPNTILQNDINHFKRADYICAVSEFSKSFAKQYLTSKPQINVIYNPIENDYFNESKAYPGPIVILFFGKIIRTKGAFNLINAFNKIADKLPGVILQMIGDGEIEFAQSLVDEKYKNRVIFSGFMRKDDLMNEIDKAFVCVLPSYFETFSMSVLEVYARKRALIFTNRSSGPELIKEGQTGWLIDPENVEELSKKIVWVFNHPNETINLAENGFNYCLNYFSTDIIIPKIEKYYNGICNKLNVFEDN